MDVRERAHYEQLLLAERRRLRSAIANGADDLVGVAGWVDRARDRSVWSSSAAGAARTDGRPGGEMEGTYSARLSAINAALKVIYMSPDRYGVCNVCGRPIDEGRLDAMPPARVCARHALPPGAGVMAHAVSGSRAHVKR